MNVQGTQVSDERGIRVKSFEIETFNAIASHRALPYRVNRISALLAAPNLKIHAVTNELRVKAKKEGERD